MSRSSSNQSKFLFTIDRSWTSVVVHYLFVMKKALSPKLYFCPLSNFAVLLRERSASGPPVRLVPTPTGTAAWKQKMKEGKMDELEEVRLRTRPCPIHEIMVRFRKLFAER